MKIRSYIFNKNGVKQVMAIAITTHLISTNGKGQTTCKDLPTSLSKEWKLLDEKDYCIQYPKNWSLDKSGKMGLNLVLFSQPSQQDRFRENVNLLIQDLTGQNTGLDQFVKISEDQIKTLMPNGEILESKRISNEGNVFHKILFTGNSGLFNLKFLQYYWIKNEKAYVLTLTCEIAEFDKYKEPAEKIMKSFKFK